MFRFNRKAWVAAITAPLTAFIMATVTAGFGLEVTGLEELVIAAVTAGLVWLIPNEPPEMPL